MTHIINWINYHEYEHKDCNDWKKESSELVDMGSGKDEKERKYISVHHS